uniref:Uncharacterized protein n=1 Tax=Daphnia galeata TaxID=27404 RepID=A0A8J2RIW4_9CRUS|nr:unnamed protein product [Daphnia galeata]
MESMHSKNLLGLVQFLITQVIVEKLSHLLPRHVTSVNVILAIDVSHAHEIFDALEAVMQFVPYLCDTLMTKVDRATCCLQHSNQPEDICGRFNCTVPCTEPETFNPHPQNDPTLLTQHSSQDNKRNAFFIETTGNGALNYRQACAVESLALHNPNLKVHVLFTDAKINDSLVTLQTLVKNYANIQFVSLDVGEYIAGTLMDHWYHCL